MKFLFTHCYSKQNRGDAAIIATMLRRFRVLFSSAHITLATLDHFTAGETFEAAPQVHSFFYVAIYTSFGALGRVVKTLYVVAATTAWAAAWRMSGMQCNVLLAQPLRETMEQHLAADIVVPVGGGYLLGKNTLHDTLTVVLQLHAIVVALLLGKPVILFSQSIGPFGNGLQKFLSKVVLSYVQVIMVREALSKENLQQLGVTAPHIVETADAAFLFDTSSPAHGRAVLERVGVSGASSVVGITVRNWLPAPGQAEYEQAMAQFAAKLSAQGYAVVFVPQVSSAFHNDDDALVHGRIQQLLPPGARSVYFLNSNLTFEEVKAVFASCAYVVGTRMHSVIFALTSGVPALAIAYERKTVGIMSSLGLHEYVMPMEQVTVELLEQRFAELDSHRAEYLAVLDSHLPKERQKAERAFQEVQAFVAKSGLV
jgi:colanic acid/amylovoran biosynthesis protein